MLLNRPEISNALNSFFINCAQGIPSDRNASMIIPRSVGSCFFDNVTEIEIRGYIKDLDNSTSPGFDGIAVRIFKDNLDLFSRLFAVMANLMLNEGKFPDDCKVAVVTPIFKGGDKLDASNYRPISVLTITSKLFERVIFNRMSKFAVSNKLIANNQFGFQKGKSPEMAINDVVTFINGELNIRNYVALCAIDISKAFDSIDHQLLLQKLERLGYRGHCLNLLESYFQNRKQCVKEPCFSDWLHIRTGVPQGSIIGPLCFILYVNDLLVSSGLAIEASMFADDVVFYVSDSDLNNCVGKLQDNLNRIVAWYGNNGLRINSKKYQFAVFSFIKKS